MKYISDGTWFDKGSEAELLFETMDGVGLFKGIKDGNLDEEICMFDEFEIKNTEWEYYKHFLRRTSIGTWLWIFSMPRTLGKWYDLW